MVAIGNFSYQFSLLFVTDPGPAELHVAILQCICTVEVIYIYEKLNLNICVIVCSIINVFNLISFCLSCI